MYHCNTDIFAVHTNGPNTPDWAPDTVAKRTPRCISWSSIQDLQVFSLEINHQPNNDDWSTCPPNLLRPEIKALRP